MYDISPEELKDYKAYTIVDIRDSMSYAYGHLPDAISVPQAELSTYIDEWKDAGKILIYCKRGILVLFIFSHEDQFRKLRTNLSFGCS